MTIKDSINILLIGEAGVGKSTFVNSFWNYFRHESLENAKEAKELIALVQTEFTITTDSYDIETTTVDALDPPNEYFEVTNLNDDAKAYEFPVSEDMVRVKLVEMSEMGERSLDQILSMVC